MSEQPTPISLRDYWSLLSRHDWFYERSDDSRVYRAGQGARDDLERLAKTSPEHRALYHKFWEYSRDRAPKPPRPE